MNPTMYWVEEIDIILSGGDLKTEPYATMNKWYTDNKRALLASGIADEVEIGSWAVIVDVHTRKNTESGDANQGAGSKGWGYIHPPVNIWSVDCGVTDSCASV